jgi:hypothetical protein
MRATVYVNALPLPDELVALMEAGRWRSPADPAGLDRLFPERREFCCYSVAGMLGETQVIHRYDSPMWRGTPDPDNPPGDIDPKLAVLIADLGIGYDQPIALDYRPSLEGPRVLTLRWDQPAPPVPRKYVGEWRDGKRTYDRTTTERLQDWWDMTQMGGWNWWVEIAPDFKTFAKMIGL